MSMGIEGRSCIGPFGMDASALLLAMHENTDVPHGVQVDLTALDTFFSPRTLRQCDCFSRLALLGASLALQDAGYGQKDFTDWGIVLASGYGPATPTFDFLDSLLDYGETMASPLAFSHSVHNIPAAVLAKILGMSGPCATLCQYESSFAAGLLLAEDWLREGRADHILLGAVDEYTAVLESITMRLCEERRRRVAHRCRAQRPLTEGAVFFVLSRDTNTTGMRIDAVNLESGNLAADCTREADMLYFCSGAVNPYIRARYPSLDASSAYGNIPIASAFDCIAALEMLLREKGATGRTRACCTNYCDKTHSQIFVSIKAMDAGDGHAFGA